MAPIGMIEVAPSNNTLAILREDTPIRDAENAHF
jgi:hypothetical protein